MLVACLFSTVHGRTAEEKDAMKKSIRMKTTRQLKEIFDELDIGHKGLSKEELQTMAYKEDAVGRWETLHLEKKKKPRPASRGGGGGGGGMPGMEGMGDVPVHGGHDAANEGRLLGRGRPGEAAHPGEASEEGQVRLAEATTWTSNRSKTWR